MMNPSRVVEYQTHPERYRHWRMQVEGQVATLVMDIAEDGGLREGYKLKLNSYDLGVDIGSRRRRSLRARQDRIRERARDVAEMLRGDSFVYICGLRGMETGVLDALQDACTLAGIDWPSLRA